MLNTTLKPITETPLSPILLAFMQDQNGGPGADADFYAREMQTEIEKAIARMEEQAEYLRWFLTLPSAQCRIGEDADTAIREIYNCCTGHGRYIPVNVDGLGYVMESLPRARY